MTKISLFPNSFTQVPTQHLSFEDYIFKIRDGFWQSVVEKLRSKKDEKSFKNYKKTLPALTISGDFKTRDNNIAITKRLRAHSGLICLDVDKKDNPKMRTKDVVDKDCLAQFVSCSGHGIKIIYRCETTNSPEVHRRIYDAAIERLSKKGIKLKVDPIVKSIASLQYVSYDDNLYYNAKTKLTIKALPAIKRKVTKPSDDSKKELAQLDEYITALGDIDISNDYEDWMNIMFGLSYSLGEAGRKAVHQLSKNYPNYSKLETDEKFDACLERDNSLITNPVTISTVYRIIGEHLPKVTFRNLTKKYNVTNAVGVGEDIEQSDISSKVAYKLFLFEKIRDKETNLVIDLKEKELNLNAFEKLLRDEGFYKYDGKFVHIKENIVENVDLHDIIRIVTDFIEKDGNYAFSYKGTEYNFNWADLIHLWRKIRAQGTTYNQIASSVTIWQPNLLKDTATTSYIPYQNGVLTITAKKIELLPYSKITYQIWKERILPRKYLHNRFAGMFEEFFINVTGRGETRKLKKKSKEFFCALWCYGYMLQGTKRQSSARAWMLYDMKAGNNGRTGKSLIGIAVSHIRSVVVIDGKRTDLNDRFAFQRVQPWTDVVFIDDPKKYTSIVPLFNVITGGLEAEGKGMDSFMIYLKIMIAANWIMEIEGESETGRQFITQLNDFYVRYSKEHDNTVTPLVDFHGKEFFTDWDEKDWSQFDSFSAQALQYHLSKPAPENKIVGNVKLVRFIQQNDEDMFYQLCLTFKQFLIKVPHGYAIPQPLLVATVQELHGNLSPMKCGKVVKEFFDAIGISETTRTSLQIGGTSKMHIKFATELSKIDFGIHTKLLPPYKNI